MSVVIEKFRVVNRKRGSATCLCSFDANMGALSIKGLEVIQLTGGKVFLGLPNNRYQDKQSGEWRTFNYVAFNGERGAQLQEQLLGMAKEEYSRRNTSSPPMREQTPTPFGGARQPDSFGDDNGFGGGGNKGPEGFGW